MPRGENPNSRANLRPQNTRTKKEQREIARKGGKASGEVRKAKSTFTEALKEQCTPEVLEALSIMLVKRARNGNLKALEMLRDQIGEKPTEKIAVSTVNEDAIGRLQAEIKRRRSDETIAGSDQLPAD